MATIAIFPGSRFEPAEFLYTAPIRCAGCGTVHDADSEDRYTMLDGKPFCSADADCYTEAAEKEYRREASAMVMHKLDAIDDELGTIHSTCGEPEIEDDNHPTDALDELRNRMRQFANPGPRPTPGLTRRKFTEPRCALASTNLTTSAKAALIAEATSKGISLSELLYTIVQAHLAKNVVTASSY